MVMQKNKILLRSKIDSEVKNVLSRWDDNSKTAYIYIEEVKGETPLGGSMRLSIDIKKEEDE